VKSEAIKELISFLKLIFTILMTADFSLIAYVYEKNIVSIELILVIIVLASSSFILMIKIFQKIKQLEEME